MASVEPEDLKALVDGLPERGWKTPTGGNRTGVSDSYARNAARAKKPLKNFLPPDAGEWISAPGDSRTSPGHLKTVAIQVIPVP